MCSLDGESLREPFFHQYHFSGLMNFLKRYKYIYICICQSQTRSPIKATMLYIFFLASIRSFLPNLTKSASTNFKSPAIPGRVTMSFDGAVQTK